MPDSSRIDGLTTMLDRIETAADKDGDGAVSVSDVRREFGLRAFGPLLLLIGLIVMSPIGGIPSVPTAGAVLMVVIVGQLLVGREDFWLPAFIADRSVTPGRLKRAVSYLRPVARLTDRVTRRRIRGLTRKPATYAIALACVAIALVMPVLEMIPFANTTTAAAITAFGLGLVAEDGLAIAIAFAFTAASFWLLFGYAF